MRPAPVAAAQPGRTRAELADRLGVDMRTITKWVKAGLPVLTRGRGGQPSRYDEVTARAWVRKRTDQAKRGMADLMEARTRKETAQAKLAEQQYLVRSGRLISVDEVERIWSGFVAGARARLLSWATALSDRVTRRAVTDGAAGVEQELEQAVHQVLTEFATRTDQDVSRRRTRRRRKVGRPGTGTKRTRASSRRNAAAG